MNSPQHSDMYDHFRREHDELRDALGQINQVLASREASAPQVVEHLTTLRRKLEEHFQEEEVDGLFDQLLAQAPRLDNRVRELRADHQHMLGVLDELQGLAADGQQSPAWWEELAAKFHDFSKHLMQHENLETEALQSAYEDDIGSKD